MGVMALSIGSLGGMRAASYVSTTPQYYSIDNQSQVSAVFQETLAQGVGSAVDSVNPVQYPTAQVNSNRISHMQAAQQVDQAYQAVASAFEGKTVGYQQNMMGVGYARTGSSFDAYA
jgi:hypothetical protein